MGRRAALGIAKTYPGSSPSTPRFIDASTGSDYAGVTGREDKNCTRRSCQMHSATVDILRFHRSFEMRVATLQIPKRPLTIPAGTLAIPTRQGAPCAQLLAIEVSSIARTREQVSRRRS